MGFLTKALRLAHPVRTAERSVKRAVIPKPVRSVERAVHTATNPVGSIEGAAKYAAIGAVDRAITPKKKPKRRKEARGMTGTGDEDDQLAVLLYEEVIRHVEEMPVTSSADDVARTAYGAAYAFLTKLGVEDHAARKVAQTSADSFRREWTTMTTVQPVKSDDGRSWWHPVVRPPED